MDQQIILSSNHSYGSFLRACTWAPLKKFHNRLEMRSSCSALQTFWTTSKNARENSIFTFSNCPDCAHVRTWYRQCYTRLINVPDDGLWRVKKSLFILECYTEKFIIHHNYCCCYSYCYYALSIFLILPFLYRLDRLLKIVFSFFWQRHLSIYYYHF